MSSAEPTSVIRAFNRFWTNRMGVLDAKLLDTRFSLTEARVLFELGRTAETDMLRLRHELRIDAGYLSRIVKRFEKDGLVEASSLPADGRRRVLSLTDTGKAAFEDLDVRSTEQATTMQSGLSDVGRNRLVSSMATIRELLEPTSGSEAVVLRAPIVGDFGWVVHRHGVIYAQEYGWDETFEALVALSSPSTSNDGMRPGSTPGSRRSMVPRPGASSASRRPKTWPDFDSCSSSRAHAAGG